jgi:sulfur dioxygenase
VYPTDGYNGRQASTIGEEKRSNPRIAGKTRAEFVILMNDLKLPGPGSSISPCLPTSVWACHTAAEPHPAAQRIGFG